MELPPPAAWQPPSAPEPKPKPEPWSRDPLTIAIANASLTSAGYVMARRPWLAVATGFVTVVLVGILAMSVRSVWLEIVVAGWWLAMIAHGWFLARRGPRRAGDRLIALIVTVPVLLAFGIARVDASRIEDAVAGARDSGDCEEALAALDGRWGAHYVADAPLITRGNDTIRACDLLSRSAKDLNTALTGDTDALEPAFGRFDTVLRNFPGHEQMAQKVLNRFLDRLPTKDPCETTAITNWLRERRAGGVLRRATEVVPKIAPTAILGCGDRHLAANDWELARDRYRQLLGQYPDHKLAAKATAGERQATLSIELANVRELLPTSSSTTAGYCDSPAPYSGAPAYGGGGANRALIYGASTYATQLPALWRATDPANAVIVICADTTDFGAPVQTCPYTSSAGVTSVTFYNVAIPMSVYELRTGKLLGKTQVEIGGASCPDVINYTSYGGVDLGPPSQYVAPSTSDVHAGFMGLIYP